MSQTMPPPGGAHTGALLSDAYQPLSGGQLANPHPIFTRARAEEPVFYSQAVGGRWVVTSYALVEEVLSRPDLYSSADTIQPLFPLSRSALAVLFSSPYRQTLAAVNCDGTMHARLRDPLEAAFAPARVKSMAPVIRENALGRIEVMRPAGRAELIAEFAAPLTLEVILRFFGVPASDLPQVKGWCDDNLALLFQPLSDERQAACAQSVLAFQQYCADLAAAREREPQSDLLNDLVYAYTVTGAIESMDELVTSALGTLIAGYETTAHAIANAIALLLEDEGGRWQAVRDDPGRIPAAFDEAVRYEPSVPLFIRTATQDVTLGGTHIPQGGQLLIAFIAANRDERQFPHADAFELGRKPNRHLGFGLGDHYCVGATLARLEGAIALEELSRRLPTLRLEPQREYIPSLRIRGFTRLDATWSP